MGKESFQTELALLVQAAVTLSTEPGPDADRIKNIASDIVAEEVAEVGTTATPDARVRVTRRVLRRVAFKCFTYGG